jgi:hypothetical protein
MILKNFLISVVFALLTFLANAEEIKDNNLDTKFSIYSGMFDFSDDGKKSALIGFQHQNENLNRDTFLGNISPITGAMITADNAGYIYTGFKLNTKLDH